MSDNTSQVGTDTIASDDVGGVKYQRVKVNYGEDGAATDVSTSNPLPVVFDSVPSGSNQIGSVTVDSLPSLAAGTNNIGDVDVLSLPTLPAGDNNIGNVDVATMPAAARTTDSISAALATDKVVNNLTELTPKFAKITASSSGATTIVSAVTSKKIRVLSWSLVCNGAVNVKWQSHVTPTDVTGLYYFAANGGIAAPFNPLGLFETVAGEALDINLSGAVAVGGSLVYVEV